MTCEVVERWNPHAKLRVDLFGCIDIVALGATIIGVQTTTATNMAARRTKILESEKMRAWIASGGRVLVHGWAKRGPRGERKVWTVNEEEITAEQFATQEIT